MKPVVFDGHFAWLHLAQGQHGVVLCKPPGHESQWLHRTMLELALQFADKGISTLSFDYRNNGDSLDQADPAAALDVWLAGIASAIRYLRASTGVQQVTLCGVRLGATLAALSCALDDISGLVLLAPVIDGRTYLREISVTQKVWLNRAPAGVRAQQTIEDHVELLGYRIDAATVSRLQTLNLNADTTRPAPRILLVHPGEREAENLAGHYRQLGAQVDVLPFPEYAAMMQPALRSQRPCLTIKAVLAWMAPLHAKRKPPACNPPQRIGGETGLFTADAFEQTISFGARGLFGMLCQPLRRRPDEDVPLPVVLIANTGGTSHIGEARFGVFLARHLARCGITSLRIDVSHLGDSVVQSHLPDVELEFDALCNDVVSATDWLAQNDYPQVVTLGICSGAYLSLHAALAHDNIVGVMAINLPRFAYALGTTLHDIDQLDSGSTRAHLLSLFQVDRWRNVMRGHISLAPIVESLLRHGWYRACGIVNRLSGGLIANSANIMHSRAVMRRLDQRGVRVRLLYSPLDVGIDQLKAIFGTSRSGRIGRFRGARTRIISHMDHEVLSSQARSDVAASCEQLLEECRTALRQRLEAASCCEASPRSGKPRSELRRLLVALFQPRLHLSKQRAAK